MLSFAGFETVFTTPSALVFDEALADSNYADPGKDLAHHEVPAPWRGAILPALLRIAFRGISRCLSHGFSTSTASPHRLRGG